MASGYGLIPVTDVQLTGPWQSSTPPDEYFESENTGNFTGSATITFDPNGQYELYDEFGVLIDTFLFADLPAGFQIIGIINNLTAGAAPLGGNDRFQEAPWPSGLHGPVVDTSLGGMVSWATSFGWDQDNKDFFDETVRAALLAEFTFTGDYFRQLTASDGVFITNGNADVSFPPSFVFANTAVLIFEWNDEGPIGPPLGPVTNPELGPGPTITVTPPIGAGAIIVEVPGEPTIVEPVTPNVPITVPLPPGATVVTVTPIPGGGGGSGPPVIVPINLNISAGGIPINIGITSPITAIINPSGIYTLVPGKTHDTLYDRNTATTTSQNVKIPNPFIKTAYIGD